MFEYFSLSVEILAKLKITGEKVAIWTTFFVLDKKSNIKGSNCINNCQYQEITLTICS